MITGVSCGSCGQPLEEQPADTASAKVPCPLCGSELRNIKVLLRDTISIHARLSQRSKQGRFYSIKKKRWLPAKEIFSGDDFFKRTSRWSVVRRVIDRAGDWYSEFIYDRETGEIHEDKSEPLSAHINHGSAKARRPNRSEK